MPELGLEALKQRIDELKFDKIPDITRNIQSAMKENVGGRIVGVFTPYIE